MPISIHPSAIESFNKRAVELISLIKDCPRPDGEPRSFPSEIPVNTAITDEEIIEFEEFSSDYRGLTVARFFNIDNTRYGLDEESYTTLSDLASSIAGNKSIKDHLSEKYIEDIIFEWVKTGFKEGLHGKGFTDFLIKSAIKDIKKFSLWVPIANLEVETCFEFGRVKIRPVTADIFDEWENIVPPKDDQKDSVKSAFKEFRNNFQGRAAVFIAVEAEPIRASEIALEEADRVTSLLGIFSWGTVLPDVKCVSKIKGSETIAMANVICTSQGSFQLSSSILERSSAKSWRLDDAQIVELRKTGMDAISKILQMDALSEFHKTILNSLFIYSKSAFTSDPVEKIVYILTSLESILLKNENEPIQQNLSERIAVFVSSEFSERKNIISIIKSIYSIRSKYLHHGNKRSEMDSINDFMQIAWDFYSTVLSMSDVFKDKMGFVSAIDDAKLG